MATINKTPVKKIRALNDTVLVSDMYFGERLSHGGIVILDDDKKNEGIRPRWAKIYATGPEAPSELEVGKWIYVTHGRWTRGITIVDDEGEKVIRKVDNNDIMLIADEKPEDFSMSDKVI